MERHLGRGPKIALFSVFGRVITLLIAHMFWEWARGGFSRIRITILALKKPNNQPNPDSLFWGHFSLH